MNCKSVQNHLSAYIDGELAGSEMLVVRQHVLECAACSGEAEEIRRLKALIANTNQCTPPADFEERLVAHVFRAEKARAASGWRAHIGLAGVAVAAAAAAFFVASQVSGPVKQPSANDVAYSSEMTSDQAYFYGMDPLGGPTPVVPASYAGQ